MCQSLQWGGSGGACNFTWSIGWIEKKYIISIIISHFTLYRKNFNETITIHFHIWHFILLIGVCSGWICYWGGSTSSLSHFRNLHLLLQSFTSILSFLSHQSIGPFILAALNWFCRHWPRLCPFLRPSWTLPTWELAIFKSTHVLVKYNLDNLFYPILIWIIPVRLAITIVRFPFYSSTEI